MRPPRPARRLARAQARALAWVLAPAALLACTDPVRHVTPLQRIEAERAIRGEVTDAYDFGKPGLPARMMALYAPDARIVSASGGQVVTSRDSIRMGIDAFWTNVGRNMRNPKVEWTQMFIDVLAPNVAVMTATYRIPHRQPNGLPHVIGGAWTAVFERRGDKWLIVQEHLSDAP